MKQHPLDPDILSQPDKKKWPFWGWFIFFQVTWHYSWHLLLSQQSIYYYLQSVTMVHRVSYVSSKLHFDALSYLRNQV